MPRTRPLRVEQLGEGILNLPQEERAKFTLEAVGPDMMKTARRPEQKLTGNGAQ